MKEIGTALTGETQRLPVMVFLGRGLSYASALAAALNLQEAAKMPAIGMPSAEFRHGPLEMADERLSALVFEGAPGPDQALNRRIWNDLQSLGARACLVGQTGNLPMPVSSGIGLPLAEFIPVQLLTVYLTLKKV